MNRQPTNDRPRSIPCAVSQDELAARVRELARQISVEYRDRHLLMIGVLKGAWVFLADLLRELTVPVHCDFVRLFSYGSRMVPVGEPKLLLDVMEPVQGRDLLVVDDIVDTGHSLAWLRDHLLKKNPASLRFCVLLDKPSRRAANIEPDYVGFQIPDRFVVGYGIDYAEQYRWLPYIGYVDEDDVQTKT